MALGPKDRALAFLDEELSRLEAHSLLREPRLVADGEVVLCSNDYLGLAKRGLSAHGPLGAASGAGASPLVVGFQAAHARAEEALAHWLETEAALLFSSGFAANLGVIGALVGRGDVVISDALNHASIIDGCRLSGAEVLVVPHVDVDAIAERLRVSRGARRRLVVTESYFSMDADGPDLARLRRVCSEEGAILMVDEAHSLGVEGPLGRGRCADSGVVPDVLVGTLGKSMGLQGAFVAGSAALRLFLWNRARPLMFSTGLSPAIAAEIPGRVAAVAEADGTRQKIRGRAEWIRSSLVEQGWRLSGSGHVVPILVGAAAAAIAASNTLRREGLLVQAIRPPTVPEGSSRLRLTVTSDVPEGAVHRLIRTLGSLRPSKGTEPI